MRATVTSENGGPVRLRTAPGGDTITKLPVGTPVEILTSGPEWSVIQYAGGTGYIMTAFLDIAGEEDRPDTITVTMTVAQAEELVQQIVNQIGRG